MPDLNKPCAHGDLPPLMQLSVGDITRELSELNPGYRLVLSTKGLSVEDVAELLWDSRGSISHLEIFNMRGWMEGKHSCLKAISELQQALNEGLGPRVKQMIRTMVRRMSTQDEERAAKFRHILHNVPKLWEHYRNKPLGSRLGTSSVSRDSYGMGFVRRLKNACVTANPAILRPGKRPCACCAICPAAAIWVWNASLSGRPPAWTFASAPRATCSILAA